MSDIRALLNNRLQDAMRAKDPLTTGTIRLILAALKDRDIAARSSGNKEGVEEADILSLLQSMIKQRRESIMAYYGGGREDLAKREEAEIFLIQTFLPPQMGDAELEKSIKSVLAELGSTSIKDMGRIMATMKERYAGRFDAAKVGVIIKKKLSGG